MRESIIHTLPWLLSFLTILMTIVVGNKSHKGWMLGLFNQMLWVVWIIAAKAWGFIPLNICLTLLYARNYYLWDQDEKRMAKRL